MIVVGKVWANYIAWAGSQRPQRDLNSRLRRERAAIYTLNNNNDRLNPPKIQRFRGAGGVCSLPFFCGQSVGK